MPTTITHTESGQVKYVGDDEVDSYKAVGWEVDESATQDADGVNKNPDSGDVAPEPPNKSDSKSDWVDYAVSQGWDREDAEDATKDDLYNEFS